MIEPDRYEEFASLLKQASGQLVAYLHALLLDWNDTEDVFQETSLVLWKKFDEFQPNTNFVGWALRVAQNNARNHQKAKRRHARLFNDGLQESLLAVAGERTDEKAGDDLAALAKCMDRLSEADRCLVDRCYGDRMPVQRVAAQLGRPPQSVHHSLQRIRMQLVECVKDAQQER